MYVLSLSRHMADNKECEEMREKNIYIYSHNWIDREREMKAG